MRLQVMHLPAPEGEYPGVKETIGARGVLIFEHEVEVA